MSVHCTRFKERDTFKNLRETKAVLYSADIVIIKKGNKWTEFLGLVCGQLLILTIVY